MMKNGATFYSRHTAVVSKNKLKKGKAPRKHSLNVCLKLLSMHGHNITNSSLGFIEAFHQL